MLTWRLRLLVLAVLAAAASLALVLSGDERHGDRVAEARPIVDPGAKPAQVRGRPHVVMIVLDELTSDSLLGPDGRIDAVRYPYLAGLAANATWFPNAWSAYDSTPKAVPLIFDGVRPFKTQPPDARGHRRTLLDAFARRGYRIRVSEEATAVCPRRYCPRGRRRRPGILGNLNRGRQERLEGFFASIGPSRKPTFWLKHTLLPHGPYLFLPSGMKTRRGVRDPVPGMNGPRGFHDRFLTRHNYQRYLLQAGFVDHELGKLLRRLVDKRMFDRTMIVVTADHGIAWEVGVKDRRKVTNRNVDEITPVPLLVKAPGQRRGRIERAYASTLDIAPTIADVLNLRLPYRASGRSAFSRAVRRRRVVRLPTRDFSRVVRISARRFESRRRANIRRRLQLFGAGPIGLYTRLGPNRHLIGRQVTSLRVLPGRGLGAQISAAGELRRVRRSTGVVPAQIAGEIRGGRGRRGRAVAVAVNGRIETTGETFFMRGDRAEYFAANVPESTLREGANTVEVFEVRRGRVLRRLARV